MEAKQGWAWLVLGLETTQEDQVLWALKKKKFALSLSGRGSFELTSRVLLTGSQYLLITPLLFGVTRCSTFVLCVSCFRPVFCCLSKGSCFLQVGSGVRDCSLGFRNLFFCYQFSHYFQASLGVRTRKCVFVVLCMCIFKR